MIAELCAQELYSSRLCSGSNDTSGVARMLECGLASRVGQPHDILKSMHWRCIALDVADMTSIALSS